MKVKPNGYGRLNCVHLVVTLALMCAMAMLMSLWYSCMLMLCCGLIWESFTHVIMHFECLCRRST